MDLGFWEMVALAVLALLIFGPERLPGIARSVGQTIGRIRAEANSTFQALRDEAELSELSELNTELQRERSELRELTRVDTSESKKPVRRKPSSPPRFDPDAT